MLIPYIGETWSLVVAGTLFGALVVGALAIWMRRASTGARAVRRPPPEPPMTVTWRKVDEPWPEREA